MKQAQTVIAGTVNGWLRFDRPRRGDGPPPLLSGSVGKVALDDHLPPHHRRIRPEGARDSTRARSQASFQVCRDGVGHVWCHLEVGGENFQTWRCCCPWPCSRARPQHGVAALRATTAHSGCDAGLAAFKAATPSPLRYQSPPWSILGLSFAHHDPPHTTPHTTPNPRPTPRPRRCRAPHDTR